MDINDLPYLIANPAQVAANNWLKNNQIINQQDNLTSYNDLDNLDFDKLDKHTGIGALLLLIKEYENCKYVDRDIYNGVSLKKLCELWKMVEKINYPTSSFPWAIKGDMILYRLQSLLDILMAAELIEDPNLYNKFDNQSHYIVTKLGHALLIQNNLLID